ncbi:hypothetical protein V496_06301 [Pseudogymnoascus sp. VKM F-4515 (FW-2607)]|nr:hypothetical protein V496_06301 [Pseudogymnoascus sp. VKM F-4515 (FW-2607)]KFY87957.1 hypothetical protein V498_06957 [Pseudogymnoascus sp. VKM F-4517 (FW-2822)]
MFNALNRFISRLDSDAPAQTSTYNAFGFQVLRNKNADLPIEPWFDFIVGINGRMIEDSDPNLFAQEVRNCAGGTVTLGLWSAKGQRTRTLHIPIPSENPTLGISLQHAPLSTVATIWHILDVPANSPADLAGLLPYSDYILGTPEGILHGEAGLGELVEDHIGRPLRLYVYNNEYDVTREVTIQPSRDWGGEGALGCVLGYGALHRIPAPLSEPIAEPGSTLFDGEPARFSNEESRAAALSSTGALGATPGAPSEFLIPAQLAGAAPPPPASSDKAHRKHGRGHDKTIQQKGGKLDDYFMEGEQKSRELDYVPSAKSAGTPPPPPPKSGGPPKAAVSGPPKGGPPKAKEPKETEKDEEEDKAVAN